ncbi:hypothetical protein E1140_12630 [Fulvivirga lutimaris]|nr:hypothetical protein [Fulvivirga lutimaris]
MLEKLTWGFIIAIFALSIGTNLIDNTGNGGTDPFIDRAQEEQVTPALDLGGVEESTDDAGSESLEDLSGSDSIN